MPERNADTSSSILNQRLKSKALNLEPQTGDAALQHLNRLEYADIILDIEDGGTFFAHRAYLTRSNRLKSYGEEEKFVEGSAPVVSVIAPIPSQFYDVLYHLYTGAILPSWFGPDRYAESLCTLDYFMLEDVKKEVIKRFPSLWKSAITSSFFAPKWIPIEILSELMAFKEITAADKIRIIGAWFGRGDVLSPDAKVPDVVLSKCAVDQSMTPETMRLLREDLGRLVFNRVVPGSYVAEVYDSTLAQIKNKSDSSMSAIQAGYTELKASFKVWECGCRRQWGYFKKYGRSDTRKCPSCSETYSSYKVVTDVSPWEDFEKLLK